MLIANLIRAVYNVEGSIGLLDYITLLHQVRQNAGGILVPGDHLLSLGELLLELPDLTLPLIINDLGKTLSLHLLPQVSLCSTALRASFEEVSTASVCS